MISVGWTLAAIVLFWAGHWHGQITRYDECDPYPLPTRVVYLCVEGEPSDRPLKGDPA